MTTCDRCSDLRRSSSAKRPQDQNPAPAEELVASIKSRGSSLALVLKWLPPSYRSRERRCHPWQDRSSHAQTCPNDVQGCDLKDGLTSATSQRTNPCGTTSHGCPRSRAMEYVPTIWVYAQKVLPDLTLPQGTSTCTTHMLA